MTQLEIRTYTRKIILSDIPYCIMSESQTPDHVERFVPSPRWGYEATLSLKLMQWANARFPQPQIKIVS